MEGLHTVTASDRVVWRLAMRYRGHDAIGYYHASDMWGGFKCEVQHPSVIEQEAVRGIDQNLREDL
ncbi:hypothetical protein BKK79_02225 [Cupriavidus sp. USMAA2-4]|nr:hypothetical protein BKK79_02225 [Cupriavidus sp. USMAA2-4]